MSRVEPQSQSELLWLTMSFKKNLKKDWKENLTNQCFSLSSPFEVWKILHSIIYVALCSSIFDVFHFPRITKTSFHYPSQCVLHRCVSNVHVSAIELNTDFFLQEIPHKSQRVARKRFKLEKLWISTDPTLQKQASRVEKWLREFAVQLEMFST